MTGSIDAHARTRELAAIALDFPLEPGEQAELDVHLADCNSCRLLAAALRRDIAAVAALPDVDAPGRVRRRVLGRPAQAPGRRSPRLAPIALIAVLALVVTPLAFFRLFTFSSPGSPADPSTAATGGPTSAPTQVGAETWAAAQVGPPAGARPPGSFAAVTYLEGRGFAAVGESCPADVEPDSCRALAATSVDGRQWDLAEDEDLVIEPLATQQAGMRGLTAGGPGVVAVGVTGAADGRPHAAVWLSPYGRDWQRAADDPSFDGAWMNAVTRTDAGLLVAVGGALRATGGVDAAIWTSSDGETWSRGVATVEDGLNAGAVEPVHDGRPAAGLAAVADLPAGGLLALGATCPEPDGPCSGAQWTSVDGHGWTSEPSAALAEGMPAAAVTFEGGVVAVGQSGDEAAAWTTTDGEKWDRVAGLPTTGVEALLAVTATAGGLLSGGRPAEVWAATDATDWWVLADGDAFSGATITGLAAGAGVHVAVGFDERGYPSAWVGEKVEGPAP